MHFRLTRRGDEFTLTDLTPASDVRVNDRVIKSRKIAIGDRIAIGATVLEVHPGDAVPATPAAPAGDDILLVGTKTMPIEAVVDPEPQKQQAAAQPAAAPKREIRIPRVVVTSDTATERPSGEGRHRIWIVVSLLLILAVGATVGYSVFSRNQIKGQLRQASSYAERNPEDYDGIIKRYQAVQGAASRGHEDIAAFLGGEITRLEGQKRDAEDAFKKTLASLDQQAETLRNEGRHEEAVKVYENVSGAAAQKRVLEMRKDLVATLRAEGEEARKRKQREAEQKVVEEAKQQQDSAKTRLAEIISGAVDAAVESRAEAAVQLLDEALANAAMASVTSRVEKARDDMKMLAAVDQTVRNAQAAGQADFEPDLAAACPLVRVVYALRIGDVWKAQEGMVPLGGHLLYDALLLRTKIPDEEARAEKDAIQGLAEAWGKLTKSVVKRIPKPEECVALLNDPGQKQTPAELQEAARALLEVATRHASTRLVKRYDPLFRAAAVLQGAAPKTGGGGAPGLGDGRIIQRDGNTYFAEVGEVPANPESYRIGLYREQTAYYHVSSKQPLLSRGTIYAVVPFKLLADKQVSFTYAAPEGEQPPATNDCVILARDLREGSKILTGPETGKAVSLFKADFEHIGNEWQGRVSKEIKGGRLWVDSGVGQDRRGGLRDPDIWVQVNAGKDPVRVTMDVMKDADRCFIISLGAVTFRTSGLEGRQGIYVDGRRVCDAAIPKPAGGKMQRMILERDSTTARMDIDGAQVSCPIGSVAGCSDVTAVGFTSDGGWQIDNMSVERIAGSGEAHVEAIDREATEVLVIPGQEVGWSSLKKDSPLFFFRATSTTGGVQAVGSARLVGSVGNWLICALAEGTRIVPGLVVSLLPQVQAADVSLQGGQHAPRTDRLGENESAFGTVTNIRDDVVHVTLDSWRGVPAKGHLCLVEGVVRHPSSGEALSVTVVRSAPCDFRQNGSDVVCLLPAALKGNVGPHAEVLISRAPVPDGKRVDIAGQAREYTPSGVTRKQTFWGVVGKEWSESKDGLSCKPGPAVALEMKDSFSGNAQWDLEAVVENEIDWQKYREGDERERLKWLRELIVQVTYPGLDAGVSMGLGTMTAGGGFVAAGVCVRPGVDRTDVGFRSLPQNSEVRIDGNWAKGLPALVVGEKYRLRFRKAGSVLACYVNGKRIGRIKVPGTEGMDAVMTVCAPQGGIKIGRVRARELTAGAVIPDIEPVLGEFGYVLAVNGPNVIVDSDANTMTSGRKFSVMAIGNVVRGEQSLTVMMKRVGQGTVSDAGTLTTRLVMGEGAEDVKAGMKILPGTLQPDTVFAGGRILDLREGL